MKTETKLQYAKTVMTVGFALLLLAGTGQAGQVKVTVENIAPSNGLRLTPVWIGFHDGSFDTFSSGLAASPALEKLAEDGDPSSIVGSFAGANQGVVFGPVTNTGEPPIYHPGERASMTFTLDPSSDLYLSYLSMAIPSNDAFIGNDSPTAYPISSGGSFQDFTIDIFGSDLWDAGTEINDEIAANTPLLGQAVANTGMTEIGGLVGPHGGFLAGGSILTQFPNADFTADGYPVARIHVQAVPAPGSLALVALGLGFLRRKRRLA